MSEQPGKIDSYNGACAASEQRTAGGSRTFILLALIVILGVVLRIGYLVQLSGAPDFSALQQDPEVQDYFARALITGDWSVPEGATDPEMKTTPFYRPPGYGYLLTVLYFVSNGSYYAPRILNLILGIFTILLLHALGKRYFGEVAGLAAAFLAAIYSVFIYWEGEVNDPAVFVFFVPALFYVLDAWSRTFKLRYLFLAGLIFGGYGLARPNILGFGPVVAAWILWVCWRKSNLAHVFKAWPLLLCTTLSVIIPVTIRNYVASGEFVPVSTYFGLNLLIGNHEQSDEVTPWLPYLQELEGGGNWSARDYINVVRGVGRETGTPGISHREVSRYFTAKALAYMREHPGTTLLRMVRRAVLLWTPVEITCNKVVHYELRQYLPLRILPGFPVVAALFWLGLAVWCAALLRGDYHPRSKGITSLLVLMLLFLGYYLLSFVPFFVNGRARIPAVPLLILFGGYAVQTVFNAFKSRRYAAALLLLVFGSILFAAFSFEILPVSPDKARWHYQRADSWIRRGEIEKARLEARNVIENEGAPYMHQRLGRYFTSLGLLDDAIAQYKAGIARDPRYQDLFYLLGVSLKERGDTDEAEKSFRSALELNPYDARALNALGELYYSGEKYSEALECFENAFKVAPDYGDVIDNISRAMKAMKRGEEAIERYRGLLAENPNQPFVHYILGRDLAETGRAEEAMTHFAEAVRLDPHLDGARYLWAQELSRLGRIEEAIEQHQQALALNPNLKYTQAALGRELSRIGKAEEAAEHFREAIRIDPNYQDARYMLGRELAGLNRIDEAVEQYQAAIQLNPNDARAHLEMGMFWAEQGELETALKHYEEALRVKPDFAYALDRIGRILALLNRSDEAIARYEEAIQADPKNQDIHFLLGRELLAQGKKEEAEKRFREALALNPEDARCHNELGTLLEERGETDEAMRHYEEALRAAPQFGYVLYKMGKLLSGQGKYTEAEARFEEALNLDPDNQDLYYLIGRELVAQGRKEEGQRYFERALSMNPDDARVHNDLALLIGAGDPEAAIAHFEKALQIAPNFTLALNNWGNLLAELNRFDEAEQKYRAALNLREEDEYAWYNLARLAERKGNLKEAEQYYMSAMQNSPDNSHIPNNLGLMYAGQGRFEEATVMYERALSIDAENPLPLNNLGQTAEKQGRTDAALEYYSRALRLKPSFLVALNNIVSLLSRMGRSDEARTWFEKAFEADPNNGDVHNSYGYYLYTLGQFEKARQQFQTALAYIPEFPLALNNLGNLEMDQNNLKDAENYFMQALKIHENDLNADFNLGRLYLLKGDRPTAINHFTAMVVKHPDNVLLEKAAASLVDIGEIDAAILLYEKALERMPELTAARFQLASLLYTFRQDSETALRHLEQIKGQDPGLPGLEKMMNDIRTKL